MNTTATPLPQLTFRAILLAIILAMLLAAANTYLGLFAGLTIASAIPAAVVSMGVLRALGGGHILENNIVQTGASAAASIAAGVIFTIPALVILGYWSDFKYMWVFAIAGLGGILGVLFSVPLRRALILEQKLAFPEGKAAAEVLRAGANPEQGVKLLAGSALLGGIVKLSATSGLRLIPDTAAAADLRRQGYCLLRDQPVAGVVRRGLHRRPQRRHRDHGRRGHLLEYRDADLRRVLPGRQCGARGPRGRCSPRRTPRTPCGRRRFVTSASAPC